MLVRCGEVLTSEGVSIGEFELRDNCWTRFEATGVAARLRDVVLRRRLPDRFSLSRDRRLRFQ